MLIGANNLPLTLTPALVLQIQNQYLQILQRLPINNSQSLARKKAVATSEQAPVKEADQVWTNAVLIGSLLSQTSSVNAVTIKANNFMLLSKYASLIGKPLDVESITKGRVPNWVTASTARTAVNLGAIFLQSKGSGYAYSQQCAKNGVPIPPAWGSPDWIKVTDDVGRGGSSPDYTQNPLATNYLTPPSVYPSALTEVYYYTPPANSTGPKGLCIALPIVQDTLAMPNMSNALGIICQGVSTTTTTVSQYTPDTPSTLKLSHGKRLINYLIPNTYVSNSHACFWDNASDIPKPTSGQTYPIEGSYFLAPPGLPDGNQCTDCHAGENAFIIHPSTPLQTAKDNAADPAITAVQTPPRTTVNFKTRNNWYTPLVQPNWPQNPETSTYPAGNGLCGGCHTANDAGRLPDVAMGLPPRDHLFKYCNFLLPNVLQSTVSPVGTMASSNTLPAVTSLYNTCAAIFSFTSQSDWLKPVLPPH